MDRKGAEEHIRNHVNYPTTGEAIKQACNNMSHLPADDRKWMTENLPNGSYGNPESVLRAIGWAK